MTYFAHNRDAIHYAKRHIVEKGEDALVMVSTEGGFDRRHFDMLTVFYKEQEARFAEDDAESERMKIYLKTEITGAERRTVEREQVSESLRGVPFFPPELPVYTPPQLAPRVYPPPPAFASPPCSPPPPPDWRTTTLNGVPMAPPPYSGIKI